MFLSPKNFFIKSDEVRQLMDMSGWDAQQTQLFFGWLCLSMGPTNTRKLCDELGLPPKVFKAGRDLLDPPAPKVHNDKDDGVEPGTFAEIRKVLDKSTRQEPDQILTRVGSRMLQSLQSGLGIPEARLSPATKQSIHHALGYGKLPSPNKGGQWIAPDPAEFFGFLDEALAKNLRQGVPVLFVECRPRAKYDPRFAQDHEILEQGVVADLDVLTDRLDRLDPNTVCALGSSSAFVHLAAVDEDRGRLAADCLNAWWRTVGKTSLQHPDKLFVVCDDAGSDKRLEVWEHALSSLARNVRCDIEVWHMPTCLFRWQTFAHRLFFYSAQSKAGKKSLTVEMVVQLIHLPATAQGETPAVCCAEGPIEKPEQDAADNTAVQLRIENVRWIHKKGWAYTIHTDCGAGSDA